MSGDRGNGKRPHACRPRNAQHGHAIAAGRPSSFAVQGSPSNPAHMRAHVETEVAINTPIEVSVQRGLDLQQEQLTQQQRMQPNTGTATPGTGDRIDGDTGLVFPSCSPIRSQPLARRVHSYRMKVTQPAGDRAQRITPINRRPTPGSVTM